MLSEEVLKGLMPRSVRLIPFGLICLLFVGFVLAIGPGDYLLLGLLRRRRLTWVLFPAVCAGFALLTVSLSDHYMGRADRRNAIVVVDVGAGGRELRRDRFEAIFAGRRQRAETKLSRCLFTPIGRTGGATGVATVPYTEELGGLRAREVSYAGRIPQSYRVRQEIYQWSPQLNRHYAVAPVKPAAEDAAEEREADLDVAPGIFLSLVRGGRVAELESMVFGGVSGETALYVYCRGGESVIARGGLTGLPSGLVGRLCDLQGDGVFGVVSQLSPAGGASFDDVALLDAEDGNQWLLVAAVRRGNDIILYRRLYYAED
jgi:hypothetical protein